MNRRNLKTGFSVLLLLALLGCGTPSSNESTAGFEPVGPGGGTPFQDPNEPNIPEGGGTIPQTTEEGGGVEPDAGPVNPLCVDQECGGPCGVCAEELACVEGKCVEPPCEPVCDGIECGPDGCGDICGECPSESLCAPNGTCVFQGCQPECEGLECGPDGCGDICGACSEPLICLDGLCVEEPACVSSCLGLQCGDDGCGGSCGVCPDSWDCIEGTCELLCELDCVGKQCGYDGCGGVCGTCAVGETCSPEFQCEEEGCVPECGNNECGPNGCGGLCGICFGADYCVDGTCVPPLDGCTPQEEAGCNGCACEECVCGYLSSCCDVKWTQDCVEFCGSLCGGC